FVFPGQTALALQSPSPMPLPTGPAPVPVNSSGLPPAVPMPGTGARPSSEILRISDSITVSFSDLPPPGQIPVTQRIRDDGKITLPYNVVLVAAGKTIGELQEDIRNAYVPKIFVVMTPSVTSEERVFFVEGEVKQPSRLLYKGDVTVLRAITSAGGFTD